MPTLSPKATTSTVQEVKLVPSVRKKLLMTLRAYDEVKQKIRALEFAADIHKAVIASIREETGEITLSLDGYTTTLVAPTRRKFNPKKFVALGGILEVYNEANETVPSKSYEKVTCPGAQEED